MSNAETGCLPRIEDLRRKFIREIELMSPSYAMSDKFRDAVRMMAISIYSYGVARMTSPDVHKSLEEEFSRYEEKYGKDGSDHVTNAFLITIDMLSRRRTDFLGHVMEEIGAANQKGTQQFLTPECVAKLMARCISHGAAEDLRGHDVKIRLNDPACGASVLLIEQAEQLILEGNVSQRDIIIYAEDLDFNAFNISYVQLALLGYAAQVTRMDSLSQNVLEGPWLTPGVYLHCVAGEFKK